MSVVGFDLGNESGIVGVARQRGIDVVLNEESKRETPMMVCFGDKQRFSGVAGAASQMMNPKNCVSQVKRLIGKKFSDPDVQKDIALLPVSVTEAPDGGCQINVTYLGVKRSFTPTQVLAMLLGNLKIIAEQNLGVSVVDCVMGIPAYFTDSQRREYLDAAAIAGLHPLRLMHEGTATALSYGIYKTDLSETEPLNVAFVDVGHASMQVTIVAFKKGQLKVLSHAFDRSLGGRDFDEVLYNYFSDQFKENYKIDVRSNARASLRLRAACEKMKKVLSANPEAPLNIECLMDEKDVRDKMTRDKFEELAAPILERVKGPCQRALEDSGLVTPDKISIVEVVGSGSRVPAIMKILSSFFQKDPSRTMNASESVARGCALQCAMLSPTFRVREFEVQDAYPFSIALSWKQLGASGAPPEGAEGEEAGDQSNQPVFSKNNQLPSSKLLTFYRNETFTIDAFYQDTNELPQGTDPKIGTFKFGPIQPTKQDSKPKLKVKIRLNLHGILSVESATLLEEEEVEVPVAKAKDTAKGAAAAAPMDTDSKEGAAAPPEDATAADVKMDDAGAPPAENGVEGKTDADKTEVVKKKKVKRTEVPFEANLIGGLPAGELREATEKELEMALQDRVMEETKDRKNSVEAYVYEMRNKLHDKLASYVTEQERESLTAKLQETEDWLYEDGEDEIKSVYVAKLDELKKMGDPIEERLREEETRGPAVDSLTYCISSFKSAAQSPDANKAEAWLKEKQQQQASLAKTANPVLLSGDVKKKAEMLDRFCKPIMTKPKPPPPAPKPAPAPAPASDAKPEEPKEGEAPKAEPMETDAPSPAPLKEGENMQTE
eukprot:jgi/Mesen1/2662/ME000167S01811